MYIYISDFTAICNKQNLISMLSPAEAAKYKSFKREIRANQFLVAHATANKIKSKFKYISIAHKDNFVIIAGSNMPLGADIENTKIARDFHTMAKLMDFHGIKTLDDFYNAFTSYEARYKMRPYEPAQETFYKIKDHLICIASIEKFSTPTWDGITAPPEQI